MTGQGDNAIVVDASKNNPPPGLPTPDKTLKPNLGEPSLLHADLGKPPSLPIYLRETPPPLTGLGEPPSLPIKFLNTLAKKKPHYVMVPVKVTKLKKKQLIQHQAYLANINQQIRNNKFCKLCSVRNCISNLIVNLWKLSGIYT